MTLSHWRKKPDVCGCWWVFSDVKEASDENNFCLYKFLNTVPLYSTVHVTLCHVRCLLPTEHPLNMHLLYVMETNVSAVCWQSPEHIWYVGILLIFEHLYFLSSKYLFHIVIFRCFFRRCDTTYSWTTSFSCQNLLGTYATRFSSIQYIVLTSQTDIKTDILKLGKVVQMDQKFVMEEV